MNDTISQTDSSGLQTKMANSYDGDAQVEELKNIMKSPNYIKLDEKKELLEKIDVHNFKN